MIILDGRNISEFGFEVEPGQEDPITPKFERKTIPIPGRSGLWDFGTEIREKSFAYPLKMYDRFHDNMQSAYNKLVAFLFDEYGQPRPIKLVREYEPDKFYTVKAVQQLIPDRLVEESDLILPLVADDPYKYSNIYADEVTWGSTDVFFTNTTYTYGHTNDFVGSTKVTSPQTFNITNSGLVVTPIIELDGTANNLTLSANGHSFSLPDFSNTKWIIDFERYVVFRNGQDTMIEIRDFKLLKGTNAISVTGSNININLRVKFRDRFN